MPKLQSQFKSFKSVLSLQCSNPTSAKTQETAKAKPKPEFDVRGISFGKEDAIVNITFARLGLGKMWACTC